MTDNEIRLRCLELAASHDLESVDDIRAVAVEYFNFVCGDTERSQADTHNIAIPPLRRPGSLGRADRILLRTILRQNEVIMSLVDDIKTAQAQEASDEQKLIATLEATLASNKDLSAQLAAAIAANDPAALQSVLDGINASNAAMQAEIDKTAPPPTP